MKKQYKILILSYLIPFLLIITVTILSFFSIQYLKDVQVKSQKSLFLWKRLTSTAQLRFYFNGKISDEEWNESLREFEQSLNELEQDLNPVIFARNMPLLDESNELWLFTKDLLVESNDKFERLMKTKLGLVLSEISFHDLVLNAYYEENKDLSVNDYYPFHLLSDLNADLLIILNYISSDKLFENKLIELSAAISGTVDLAVTILIILLIVFCLVIVLSAVFFIREYQADLHRNEDHLSLILNSIGDAMIVVSANSVIQKMNPIAQELTGWSLSAAQGKDLYDVFNIFEPLSGEKSDDLVEQVIKTNSIINSLEKRLLKLDEHEYRSISISAAPVVNSETTIEAVVLIFRDISKRKKQEEEINQLRIFLSNIIDSMPSALVGIDGEKKISLWNKTEKEKTGFSYDEVRGKDLDQILPEFGDELDNIDDSMKNKKIVIKRRKLRIVDMKKIYEDITIYPLKSNRDEGAVIRIDDVTERVQMEEVLVQNEKMLSLGGLAAGMAHEVNNPLSAIIQTSSIMEDRLTGTSIVSNQKTAEELGISMEKIRTYMENRKIPWMIKSIRESGLRAATIVENMLSFARKSDQSLSTHSAQEIIESTLLIAQTEYDLKKHYDFKSIKLVKNYPEEDLMFVCDKSKIQQVILNILSNGSQAMHGASIPNPQFNITISKQVAEDKDMIRIDIEDNGPGMVDKIRKQVFDPFFTTKPAGKGTGLGLSVSYFIITETHKGEIFVDSILGKGTTFTILLPLEG